MKTFYFTYENRKGYPYIGGWSEVIAANKWTAYCVFAALHPTKKGSEIADVPIANCSHMFTQEQWELLPAFTTGKWKGHGCHERITVERTSKHDCRVRTPYVEDEEE